MNKQEKTQLKRLHPIVLDYQALLDPNLDLSKEIEASFGQSGNGILLINNIPNYVEYRNKLLPLAQKVHKFPPEIKKKYERPEIYYGVGICTFEKYSFKGVKDMATSWYCNSIQDKREPVRYIKDGKEVVNTYPDNFWPTEGLPEFEFHQASQSVILKNENYHRIVQLIQYLNFTLQNIDKSPKINNYQTIFMKQNSQILSQQQETDNIEQKESPAWPVVLMIGYLYFAQGVVYSIPITVPYVYEKLLDYFALSLFSLSTIPFALKFLTAPLLQKYNSLSYGKRKTWIIISQSLASLFLLVSSFFTGQSQVQTFAFLLFPLLFALSTQDIALDALCLKELGDPKLMSLVQAACQTTGTIAGGIILLKGTSLQFAQKIGIYHPITNLKTILVCVSLFFLVPTILIHFIFTETKLETDQRTTKESILKVYSIYKYFFKREYRYFRIMIFLLLYHQGFNIFHAGYAYELINSGFSKDIWNTIDNSQSFVVSILIFLFGMKANYFGFKISFVLQVSLLMIYSLFLWIFFPTSVTTIVIVQFIGGIIGQWGTLLKSNLCANFPEMGATGMLYTMNASISTLGRNAFIHTAILKKIPWRTASIIGLAITIPIVVFFIPQMMDLIDQGQTKIQFGENEVQEGDIIENHHTKSNSSKE